MNPMRDAECRIVSAAVALPATVREVAELARDEGVSADALAGRGIDRVHVCTRETGSELGLAAARLAIQRAGIEPLTVDVIADYTVMPQDYLVPAWSMSNRLQHELGATKAFTIGFSGGLCSTLNVALHFVTSLMRTEEAIQTALLVASDKAISGNRILGGADPVTVLGDGAGAMVIKRGAGLLAVLDSELWTDAPMHDVCYIPGGAMAMPDRGDLYRLQVDASRVGAARKFGRLRDLTAQLLERHHLGLDNVARFIYPNISAEDQRDFARAFELAPNRMVTSQFANHGHIQATDLVMNLMPVLQGECMRPGQYGLVLSHGLGFTYAATLIQRLEGAEGQL